MKTTRGLVVVGMFASLFGGATLVATSSSGYAEPVSSAAASASAAPRAKRVRLPIDLASISIPETKSSFPKPDEWENAALARPARTTPDARGCTLEMLREYARVTCPFQFAAVRQFVGDIEDVEASVPPNADRGQWLRGGHVIFPLRKGHGFLFQFFTIDDSGYTGVSIDDSIIIDAYWPTSAKAPTVVLRGPHPASFWGTPQ
jgi:hypothetical protein